MNIDLCPRKGLFYFLFKMITNFVGLINMVFSSQYQVHINQIAILMTHDIQIMIIYKELLMIVHKRPSRVTHLFHLF